MLFEATASLACCAFKADKADPKILAEKFDTYTNLLQNQYQLKKSTRALKPCRNKQELPGWSGG